MSEILAEQLNRFSVIIPVKNGARVLSRCLESFLKVDYPRERLEFIVTDGLSSDKTRQVDFCYGAQVVSNDRKIVVAGRNRGFELELELAIECLDKGFCCREVPVPFRERAKGSHSKLKTFRDGIRILRFLLVLFRDYRPLLCFTAISLVLLLGGLVAGAYPIVQYVKTGLVHRIPLAVLAAAMVILAALCFLTGITLESGLRHHRESFQVRLRQHKMYRNTIGQRSNII